MGPPIALRFGDMAASSEKSDDAPSGAQGRQDAGVHPRREGKRGGGLKLGVVLELSGV
jgi:hypothetical protein